MAGVVHRLQTLSTSNTTSYASGSTVPFAGTLWVVAVSVSGSTQPTTETLTNSLGITFSKVAVTGSMTGRWTTIFIGDSANAQQTQTVTYTSNVALTGCGIEIYEVSGTTRFGLGAVRGFAGGSAATSATGTLTLQQAPLTTNALIGLVAGDNGSTGTFGLTGFTGDASASGTHSSPTSRFQGVYVANGFTSTTVTIPSYNAARCAAVVELDCSAEPTPATVLYCHVDPVPESIHPWTLTHRHPSLPSAKHYNATDAHYSRSLKLASGTPTYLLGGAVLGDSTNTTQPMSFFFGRCISDPLAAQTIPVQRWELCYEMGQTSASGETYWRPCIYVWRPGTQSVVGYIANGSNNLGYHGSYWAEWSASILPNATNAWVLPASGAPGGYVPQEVTTQNGDVIILELWAWVMVGQTLSTDCSRSVYINSANTRLELGTTVLQYATIGGNADVYGYENSDYIFPAFDAAVAVKADFSKTEVGDDVSSSIGQITIADVDVTEAGDTLVCAASGIPMSLYFITNAPAYVPTAGDNATSLPKGINTTYTGYTGAASDEGFLATIAPGNGNVSNRTLTSSGTISQQSYFFGRFSTAPLAAQEIPQQDWQWRAAVGETNTEANTFFWPVMYIWRPSNNTVVGHIFNANTNYGFEWAPTVSSLDTQVFTGGAIQTQDGDILVVECWGVATQNTTTPRVQSWSVDSNSSRLVTPYPLVFKPNSTLYLNSSFNGDGPNSGENSTVLPLGINNHYAAPPGTLNENPVNSPSNRVLTSQATVSEQSFYFGSFTSLPLQAQTIPAQKWSWEASVGDNNDAANTKHWPVLYIWRPSTLAVVGFIIQPSGRIGSDFWLSADPRFDQHFQGVEITTQDGDVLVAEMWASAIQSNTSLIQRHFWVDAANSRIVSPQPLLYYETPTGPVGGVVVTEAADTVVSTATAVLNGNLTKTEAADAMAADVDTIVGVTFAKTEQNDSFDSDVDTVVGVTFAKTEAADTFGTIDVDTIVGVSLAKTEVADSSVITALAQNLANLTKTEAADTAASDVDTVVGVTFTKTESADTVASIAKNPVIVDVAITETNDSFVSDVDTIAGLSLAVTEVSDTLVADSDTVVVANLTKTESSDTLASATSVAVVVNAAIAEANDTVEFEVGVLVQVAGASTEASDTLEADASTVAFSAIIGTVDVTEADDTLASDVDAIAGATTSRTEASDSLSGAISVVAGGSVAVTEQNDALASSGAVSVVASSANTDSNDSSVITVNTVVGATVGITESSDTVSAAATAIAGISALIVEQPDSSVISCAVDVVINFTKTETDDTVFASIGTSQSGNVAAIEADDTIAATASVNIVATSANTESSDTGSASVSVSVVATLAKTEADDTVSVDTGVEVGATSAMTQGDDTFVAAGTASIVANLASLEEEDTVSSSIGSSLAANVALVEADDSFSAPVAVNVVADFAKTETGDALASIGNTQVYVLTSITEASDSVSVTTGVRAGATVSSVENSDTLAADILTGKGGDADLVESDDTLASVAVVAVATTLSSVEADDAFAADVVLPIISYISAQEASDTLNAIVGQIDQNMATVVMIEADDTVGSVAAAGIAATVANAEVADAVVTTTSVNVAANVAATEAGDTVDAFSGVFNDIDADASFVEDGDSFIASVAVNVRSTLNREEDGDSFSSDVVVPVVTSFAATEGSDTAIADGVVDVNVTFVKVESSDVIDASGTVLNQVYVAAVESDDTMLALTQGFIQTYIFIVDNLYDSERRTLDADGPAVTVIPPRYRSVRRTQSATA